MSSTKYERISPDELYGHYVCIQHCEHTDEHGVVCNEYLGVNYPSTVCRKHRK